MKLTISGARIQGSGEDKDGRFELAGAYISRDGRVLLTRAYTWTTEPSQEGVGIPYEYAGHWNGEFVSGRWSPRWAPHYGGDFEMWPASEEEIEELRIEVQELTAIGPLR